MFTLSLALAASFFSVRQLVDGTSSFVDPLGRETLFLGTDHVVWRSNTVARLKRWGFTVSGAAETAKPRAIDFPWAINLKLGARLADGKDDERYLGKNLHRPATAFPNVFRADFEAEAFRVARKLCAKTREDPLLVGYFLDNELAWHGRNRGTSRSWGLYEAARNMPEGHSARKALAAFLATRGLQIGADVSTAVRLDFVRCVAERYFDVLTRAVRAADPNHLILGCRFAGFPPQPCIWEEAGRCCDVISVNLYPYIDLARQVVWGNGRPLREDLAYWQGLGKRPLIVTEWSFPALDAGFSNNSGEGQRFLTQRERAQASEIFARTLLSLPYVAGYSYFKYADPQPGSRQMTNYGLVKADDSPWPELTEMFTLLQSPTALAAARHASPPVEIPASRTLPVAAAPGIADTTFTQQGARWTLETPQSVVLSGATGPTDAAVATVTYRGQKYCSLEILLHVLTGREAPKQREGESSAFPKIDQILSVRAALWDGRKACQIVGRGTFDDQTFEVVVYMTPLAEAGTLVAEIAEIRNLSDRPLRACAALIRPRPLGLPVVQTPTEPHIGYGAWASGAFATEDDSRRLTVSSNSKALKKISFTRDRNHSLHPDVVFAPFCERRLMMILEPHAAYQPTSPYFIQLLCKGAQFIK